MSEDIIFNSAIPRFSLGAALRSLDRKDLPRFNPQSLSRTLRLDSEFEDLFARFSTPLMRQNLDQDLRRKLGEGKTWPVRHQHARGTCNAFAAVAAEELVRFLRTSPSNTQFDTFSEEHLYAKARKKLLGWLPTPLSKRADRALTDGGGTFLGQIRDALAKDGLAKAKDLPYNPHWAANQVHDDIPPSVDASARGRKVERTEFIHDITDAEVGTERDWHFGTPRHSLVEFFVERLQLKIPVVAAFAIMNGTEYVWTGNYARTSGHVRYPPVSIIGDGSDSRWAKRPIGGHSVCILGYAPNADGEEDNPGTFLFRNSYGTELFGRNPEIWPDQLNSAKPGYGIISARDVSRFCWEYLTRGTARDAQRLRSSGSPISAVI